MLGFEKVFNNFYSIIERNNTCFCAIKSYFVMKICLRKCKLVQSFQEMQAGYRHEKALKCHNEMIFKPKQPKDNDL